MADDTVIDLNGILARLQNRREFLQLLGKGLGYGAIATALPACGGSSSGSSDEPSSPASPPKIVVPKASPEYTVLKRTSFGPHRDALVSIKNLGITGYLEQQLDHLNIDVSALEAEIATQFPLTLQTPAELVLNFPANIFDVATQMIAATQYRQMFSERQLFEIMVEFWSDHFNIHLINGLGPTLKPFDDQQVIRTHALGNFRDMLHASAKSSAMLFYLDNFFNQAIAPNENYARELMELHTLGVDGGYTETDVKEVARCFTGWTLRFPGDPGGDYGEFVYVDAIHDDQAKLVLGNPIAAGGGQTDAEQVLDILVAHPSTANFIATKLCRRFISDSPPQAAVDTVALAFSSSNGDIKETLRALFATAAFLDDADLKIIRPSEYLAALVRSLAPDTSYPPDQGQFWFFAQNTLGQLPFYWPTPDGYPDLQSYWASTGGLLNRWRLSFLSFAGIIPGVDVITVDYATMLNGANTLAAVVDAITDAVLMRPLSSDDRSIIMAWLKGELGVTEDEILPATVPEQASALAAAVLVSSVYFHLR
ncbi:MAG: DUF1800 domain-containing protein [Gammaproteobacteria bacterium]|nr:DUF1800 domain-containing protein [Gammaproteobacteria bacterium]MDH3857298.1 DUF1800 domain-containing protein [Gammaproteobacteria bacterium]